MSHANRILPVLRTAKGSARRVAANVWQRRHRNFLLILNFHRISPELRWGETDGGTWTSTRDLESELEFAKNEFQIIPLERAIQQLRSCALHGRNCAITFDDGDETLAQYAQPILARLGVPATFFVNSAYFSGDGHYCFTILDSFLARGIQPQTASGDRTTLRNTTDPTVYRQTRERVERSPERASLPPRRCVSPEWLAGLDGDQFTIGAHGHEHQRFSMMGEQWQRDDLKANVAFLAQFKAFRPWLAVPFGRKHDMDASTGKIAAELELTVFGSEGGINLHDSEVLRRIPADGAKVKALAMCAMAGW